MRVAESAELHMRAVAAARHPRECGGVLLGVLTSHGRPWVLRAVAVVDPQATATRYELPAGARPQAVACAQADDERIGYLGDWHVHPADVGPSLTDRRTMLRVARDSQAGCARPLLIIVRHVAEDDYRLDVRQVGRAGLRRCAVVAAGGLASS